ncbi:MAG: hypothetical protein ACTHJT_02060, partial [Cytophaga sp.]|uniref:hypothetical protein n=1 Tax=Cytophaga sp. TaxID=29535 RepID=UPI003F7D148C
MNSIIHLNFEPDPNRLLAGVFLLTSMYFIKTGRNCFKTHILAEHIADNKKLIRRYKKIRSDKQGK